MSLSLRPGWIRASFGRRRVTRRSRRWSTAAPRSSPSPSQTTLKDFNLDTAEGQVAATSGDDPAGRQDQGVDAARRVRPAIGRLAGHRTRAHPARVRDFDAAAAREAKRTAAKAGGRAERRTAAATGSSSGPRTSGKPGAGVRPRTPARTGHRPGPGQTRIVHGPPRSARAADREPPDHDDEPPEESDRAAAPGPAVADMRRPNPTDRSTFVERETLETRSPAT